MTNEQEINQQIQKDYEAFYNSAYDGFNAPDVPKGTIEIFKKALMTLNPSSHQIHVNKIRIMCATPENMLLFVQAGIIVNTILMAVPEKLYDSFEQFLEYQEDYEAIRIFYNAQVEEMTRKLNLKKNRLMQLSGVTKGGNTLSLAK